MVTDSRIGIGLRGAHHQRIMEEKPSIGWLEVHSENFFGLGPQHYFLVEVAKHYEISLHGVALSLGSEEGVLSNHLDALAVLVEAIQPKFISDHLAWNRTGGHYLNDLLPVPYTRQARDMMCANIDKVQQRLGRHILVENPSAYIQLKDAEMQEAEFLIQLTECTGCKMLMDINNIFVSGQNFDWDMQSYIGSIPGELVEEVHLAGHAMVELQGVPYRIDDHGSAVCEDVWQLYGYALEHWGIKPTLIEWDTNVPELELLLGEAEKAAAHIQQCEQKGRAA